MKFTVKLATASALGALALAATASASTLTSASLDNYSLEGVALDAAQSPSGTVALPNLTVSFTQDYSINDRIDIALPVTPVNAASVTVTCSDNGATPPVADAIIAGYPPGTSGNIISFRLTQKNVANLTTAPSTCVIAGLQTTNAALAAALPVAATLGATWSGYATGFPNQPLFDTGSANILQGTAQLGASLNRPLAGVIDPNTPANGTRFLASTAYTPNTTATTDYLKFTTTNNTALLKAVTSVSATATVNGNLNYDCSTPVIALDGANTTSGTLSRISCNVSVALASPASGVTQINFGTNSNLLIPQTFSGAVSFAYSRPGPISGSKAVTPAGYPGAWTYAGAVVYIPYMPLGGGNTGVITMANRGTITGTSISIAAFNEAGTACSFTATDANSANVTAPAGTVVRLSDAILKGLKNCYGATFGDATAATARVAMTITTNAPAKDIEVYSATTGANGSRVTIVNTSNGRVVANSPGTP